MSSTGAGNIALDINAKIAQLIEPTLEAMGFELVRVSYGGGQRPTLQVMAERPDATMSVDDCADLSHELSALLDVEDPIKSEYVLEVSSPGIDRPLTRLKDFDRWAGFEAKVELTDRVDDRRRFRAIPLGTTADRVKFDLDGEEFEVGFDQIAKAKLILTDALISAANTAAQQG